MLVGDSHVVLGSNLEIVSIDYGVKVVVLVEGEGIERLI